MSDFASESGHWYTKSGEPRYTVIAKGTGLPRPTTLRDAKKEGWVPGVTTVLKVKAAPGLVNWIIDQHILAALTLPRLENELDADFIRRVKQDAKEQGAKAAEFGTKAHGELEKHAQGKPVDAAFKLLVDGVWAEVNKAFPAIKWDAERSFGDKEYGGKIDLLSEEPDQIILDFKGKDGDLADVECYDEHFMQAAAYANGIFGSLDGVVTGNCFFSRTHPGVAKIVLHEPKEQERGWRMFRGALDLWQAEKDYFPS